MVPLFRVRILVAQPELLDLVELLPGQCIGIGQARIRTDEVDSRQENSPVGCFLRIARGRKPEGKSACIASAGILVAQPVCITPFFRTAFFRVRRCDAAREQCTPPSHSFGRRVQSTLPPLSRLCDAPCFRSLFRSVSAALPHISFSFSTERYSFGYYRQTGSSAS